MTSTLYSSLPSGRKEGADQDYPNKPSETQAKADYTKARREFSAHLLHAQRVSRGADGILSETTQHYWASVLFTRMVVTATSIQLLTPDLRPDAHWDFSAVASITRNLAECYLFFFFLCADDVPQVERDARVILLNLHDNASRRKLFGELNEPDCTDEDVVANTDVQNDLINKFKTNAYLSNLPPKQQREMIRGERTPFVQDDMIERAKMDKRDFRFLYRLFSNHTHTGPIAFYRMAEHGRGQGFRNTTDTVYMTIALTSAGDLMRRATADVLVFFPQAELRGASEEAANKQKISRPGGKKRSPKRR